MRRAQQELPNPSALFKNRARENPCRPGSADRNRVAPLGFSNAGLKYSLVPGSSAKPTVLARDQGIKKSFSNDYNYCNRNTGAAFSRHCRMDGPGIDHLCGQQFLQMDSHTAGEDAGVVASFEDADNAAGGVNVGDIHDNLRKGFEIFDL